MFKKIIAVLSALIISLSVLCFPVSAAADTPMTFDQLIADIVAFTPLGTVGDFSDLIKDVYLYFIEGQGFQSREVLIVNIKAAWKTFTDNSSLTADEFGDYWDRCINELGIADDRLIMIEDTVRLGLSKEDIIAYCYSSDGEGISVNDNGSVTLNKRGLSDLVMNVNKNPSPIKYEGRVSYQSNIFNSADNKTSNLPFFKEGTFTHENLREMYILMFGYDGDTGKYYYSMYQRHYFQDHLDDGTISLATHARSILESDSDFTEVQHLTYSLSVYRYVRFYVVNNNLNYCFFKTYENYLKGNADATHKVGVYASVTDLYDFSDLSLSTKSSYNTFSDTVLRGSDTWDCGYFFSDKPIELFYNVDFTKIPDDVVIQPSGDNIYNYYIDSPSDSKGGDTINNYITNNYTFINDEPEPTEPPSSDDPSGGTTSGDITVGGQIDVSGNVVIDAKPIDINVNVNSGSESGAAPEGVGFDEEVSLNNYFDWLTEQTSGFRDFMGVIFGFMPAPIVMLLCAGFAAVVLSRFVGR